MKRALAVAGLAIAMATPTSARAEGSAPTKTWSDLPLGAAPAPPTKKTGWIGGHERLPELRVTSQNNGGGGGSAVEVFASAEEEKALREGMSEGLEGCFAEMQELTRGPTWSLGEPRLVLWGDETSSVHAVRREHVVEEAGSAKATLELVDAWVDTRTRGTRLIGRSSVPLTRVGGVLGALRVYAAREESTSGKYLHVVVVREGPSASAFGSPFMLDDVRGPRGSCDHTHVALRADAAAGDTAVLTTNVILPALPGGEPAPPSDDPLALREVRAREVEVQLGVSQTAHDRTPLVSVSFGWAGREQTAQVTSGGRFVSKRKGPRRKK